MWTLALDDLTTWSTDGTLDPVRVHHVHYTDFLHDPVGVIGELYRAFGTSLAPPTADAMRTYLAGRPKDQHGKHEYSFADLDLDADTERDRFSRYQRHFSVPEELVR
jgi:hypothetical protein